MCLIIIELCLLSRPIDIFLLYFGSNGVEMVPISEKARFLPLCKDASLAIRSTSIISSCAGNSIEVFVVPFSWYAHSFSEMLSDSIDGLFTVSWAEFALMWVPLPLLPIFKLQSGCFSVCFPWTSSKFKLSSFTRLTRTDWATAKVVGYWPTKECVQYGRRWSARKMWGLPFGPMDCKHRQSKESEVLKQVAW